ncbi:non-specific lipid transfer protein-like 1 [Brachypodium distachyon]|uniref:Bifunctional inhibitor/plant lipid transfer protein/seed storage helical domain-containing protein n=1 Tax=Brachypodium distachyon TaxID=15368 RepID=A0A0Q3I2F7_BRADI|nr:non-specific lipid transfer protein-like 1 [Brachypodium distachyon]KQK00043.1 hypothetical protein BRADI_3g46965v3 [Brachypodium distachyon]|eukprot:XP_024317230.1 non-specific lipid transfer protein-like 1 [Brachypodium distachyon]
MRCSAALIFFLLAVSRLCVLAVVIRADAGASASIPAPAPAPAPDPLLPCLEEVLPCTAYLKSAKRPAQTCCTALSRAAGAGMPCLCRLLADPGMLFTFNVTREQTLRLPSRCGLPVGCRSSATGTSEPVVEAPPPPPAVPPPRRRVPDPSSNGGGRCGTGARRAIVTVLLGGLVSIALLG